MLCGPPTRIQESMQFIRPTNEMHSNELHRVMSLMLLSINIEGLLLVT
jgi:hypothetical protein